MAKKKRKLIQKIKSVKKIPKEKNLFNKIAKTSSELIGHPWCFLLAGMSILIWLLSGFFVNFSETWQLVINTSTTIITFLVVFLIQNTQNRDMKTLQIKLDEIILTGSSRNKVIDLDQLSDEQLKTLENKYKKLAKNKHNSSAVEDTTKLKKKGENYENS